MGLYQTKKKQKTTTVHSNGTINKESTYWMEKGIYK